MCFPEVPTRPGRCCGERMALPAPASLGSELPDSFRDPVTEAHAVNVSPATKINTAIYGKNLGGLVARYGNKLARKQHNAHALLKTYRHLEDIRNKRAASTCGLAVCNRGHSCAWPPALGLLRVPRPDAVTLEHAPWRASLVSGRQRRPLPAS